MPRLRQVSRDEAPPELQRTYARLFNGRDPVTAPGTSTGTPGNWWTVHALVPQLLIKLQEFGTAQHRGSDLAAPLREMAVARTGFITGSQFVFSQHCKGMRGAGVSEEKVKELPTWSSCDLFTPAERAVLAYVDEMVLQDGRIQDGTFDQLRQHLGDEEILVLTYSIATYHMHALVTKSLRLEYDDVPERVKEILIPANGNLGHPEPIPQAQAIEN